MFTVDVCFEMGFLTKSHLTYVTHKGFHFMMHYLDMLFQQAAVCGAVIAQFALVRFDLVVNGIDMGIPMCPLPKGCFTKWTFERSLLEMYKAYVFVQHPCKEILSFKHRVQLIYKNFRNQH